MSPLMMFMVGTSAIGALSVFRQKVTTPSADETVFTLDRGMPPAMVDQALGQLVYERDWSKLQSYANYYRSLGYPMTAAELERKVASVRPPCADIDPTLDARTCASVRNALATSRSYSDLMGFAAALHAQHPKAAQALASRALQFQPPAPAPAAAPTVTEAVNAVDAVAEAVTQAAGKPVITNDPAPAAAYDTPSFDQGALPPNPPPTQAAGAPTGRAWVRIRPTDKVWPDKLAQIGSGHKNAHLELYALNPHLVGGGGIIEQFKSGDAVNVPGSWVDRLINRGFEVVRDEGDNK